MACCRVCNGSGCLLRSVCPLCDGIVQWPEREECYAVGPDPKLTFMRGPMPSEGFSLLSWNILNPDTIGLATKEGRHYSHLTDTERYWEHRWPKILDEIRVADATVVCLQEINKDLYGDIKDAMHGLGYSAVTHKKMQRNSLGIFYKQHLTKCWEAQVRTKGLEKSIAVGLHVGGRTIAVVTCHLEGRPDKALERLTQLEGALCGLQDLAHDDVVIAGDFNAPLAEHGGLSAVSSYLAAGAVATGTTEWGEEVDVPIDTLKPHGCMLSNVYTNGPAVSVALHNSDPALIDNIWFSDGMELIGVRDVFLGPSFRAEVFARGLPTEQNPSDHLPLGAVFRLR